ncbi:WD40 repeat-like protein [Coccomyxa subellipsoidea C-169]|uniref:WD40 repeat-like protein n=1 Tax=Coccomyxa subellipsoidea (strain C-169) TaxID=574566 RepID=I0Z228_COCSC|nr:WD40 repeat-like protein [Coccomyxa subellipsoidea C-169]EIE24697.1 WD40 repeat-like protein [Coccomyxa subellipsoidea C-169]|eukprot:XP_005649241.1 WD40 repeat-like protein [Coccomyxa subellipsoidea C-169]
MAHQGRVIKRTFKTPEGRFQIHSERPNACNFNKEKPTRLTLAKLNTGTFVVFNLQEYIYICSYANTDKVPQCLINFNLAPSGSVMHPTCHAHSPARDGFDLLVGLSTGDVVVASLQAQVAAPQTNTKLVSQLHFNLESSVDATRAVGVEWVPHTNGDLFVAAHMSGSVYTYSKGSVSGTGGHFSARTNGNLAPVSTLNACQKGLNAMALSPDGSRIATAGRDSVVRVHDLGTGALLTGFRTYYGNPLCCTWSPDGQYVAAGGEDDLVAVFGMEELRVVAWGEGHGSWVSAVSFDPWVVRQGEGEGEAAAAPSGSDGGDVDMEAESASEGAKPASTGTCYRLGSVGQDCQLCLWDLAVPAPRHRLAHASSAGPDLNPRALRPPARQEPARRGRDSSAVKDGSPKLLAKLSSSLHRDSSPSAHHRSDSSSSSCLPPEVVPTTPRKYMHFIQAFAAIRCATEPASDLVFSHDALFTACHGGSVKAWERLRHLPPSPPDEAQRAEPSTASAPQKIQESARRAPDVDL